MLFYYFKSKLGRYYEKSTCIHEENKYKYGLNVQIYVMHVVLSCNHSSEIRGLLSAKCSSETLQNLLYFMYKKNPRSFFRFSFRATLYFYLMNALVYVDIDQGTHKGKSKVAQNEKRKKLRGFFLYIKYIKF